MVGHHSRAKYGARNRKVSGEMDLTERGEVVEQRHPWEVVRSRFFLRLLHKMGVDRSPAHWLDVGAGDAWFAEQAISSVPAGSELTCWDIYYTDEHLAMNAERGGLTFVSDQPTDTFSGLLMLDVIEHIEDDASFVRNIVGTAMDPDGWALVSVPAYQSLFTSHDTALKHYRRYSPRACSSLLRSAGLSIEAQGSLFDSLLGVGGLQAAKEALSSTERKATGIGAWGGGKLLTRSVTLALETESRLSLTMATDHKFVVPGLSYWAFCRREL
jgi:hypothetical protein